MKVYQKYILSVMAPVLLGTIALAIGVFLLERLLKVFEVVTSADDATAPALRMLFDLVPYALSLAFPVGLFLAVLLTTDRLSRTGELSAFLGAGLSLFAVLSPMLIVSSGLAGLTLLNDGYLQPLGRYDYRSTLHRLEQTTFEAAFQEGKFARIGSRTFWTENRRAGNRLGQVFILEDGRADRNARLTTAPSGKIADGVEQDETRITLIDGQGMIISPTYEVVERLHFDQADWTVAGEVLDFRPRGIDARELVLHELLREALASEGTAIIDPIAAAAAFHNRLGRSLLLLVLPFAAISLGLGYGRTYQSSGLVIGISFLVLIQKLLEAGEDLAADGRIAPWLGTWPAIGLISLISVLLFVKVSKTMTAPPVIAVEGLLQRLLERGRLGPRWWRRLGWTNGASA
ncbi:MAG: LptF/LptG family permease [Pseudomonadota bacterium]